MSAPIRVLVADDQAILRSGLVALLRLEQGIEVVGEAADGAGTLAAVAEHRPDGDVQRIITPLENSLGYLLPLSFGHHVPPCQS